MNRDTAWKLLTEYTHSGSLIKHAVAVESAMRHYAEKWGHNSDLWGVTGLLHDFDYERWPDPPQHTREGARILRGLGVDEEIVTAILSHAHWNQSEYPLDRPLRRCLFAVDELCGFILAIAYVRPDRLTGLGPSSVRKKMKQKSFAAAVSRDDIQRGADLLELTLDEHITQVVSALQAVRDPLGLGS
jgi:putative nucleotidyltransferase with HDIG domain